MKKIYMPSMDELYQMQDMGANVYKYLVAKVVESLALARNYYGGKDILPEVYKYLRENPYIVIPLCQMYPEEIKNSEIAMMDPKLCLDLLNKQQILVSNLDFLSNFSNVVLNNMVVLRKVITMLEDELKRNPAYRFEYRDNILLDRIFNREVKDSETKFNKDTLRSLLNIEPAYGVSFSDRIFDSADCDRKDMVCSSVNNFAGTYYIPSDTGDQYFGKDILTNPETDVKRLMRCIKKYNGK